MGRGGASRRLIWSPRVEGGGADERRQLAQNVGVERLIDDVRDGGRRRVCRARNLDGYRREERRERFEASCDGAENRRSIVARLRRAFEKRLLLRSRC